MMWVHKKISVILALLITCSIPAIAQKAYNDISPTSKTSVYSESFENNSNNWFLDNLWVKGDITGGYYKIICKNYKKNSGLSYKPVSIDQSKDYEIETSVKALKGTGGLVFGMNSKFDHYRIELADNTLVIVKNTPSRGKNEVLFSGSENVVTNTGSFNKITVRKVKENFYIFLNETLVGIFDIIKPDGDQVGFNVGLNSEISIDYLNVSYIQNQVALTEPDKIRTTKDIITVQAPLTEISASRQISKAAPASSEDLSISWTSPSTARTPYDLYTARVKASVKSESELTSVLFFVNGNPKGEAERKTIPGESGVYQIEKSVNLEPGDNSVYFLVTNANGLSRRSDDRYFINPDATKPVISWSNPEKPNVNVNTDMLTIEACITSPVGLKSVKVMVNGESQGEDNLFQVAEGLDCNIRWKRSIILKEGVDNSIYIIATNNAGPATSENRVIHYSKTMIESRMALVIGNSNYGTKTPLKNPILDANLMQATLEKLGFTVIKCTDLDLNKMRAAIRDFSQKLKDYNVALFYYAGHGVQVDGKNYLIPIDAKLETKDACKWETFAVNDLMEEFEKNSKSINIAILDACRSNPFQSWVRGDAAGFVTLSNTSGTFVSFATAPGSTAADGNTGNGLFTEELVKQMNIPQPISSVFMNTRINVFNRSNKTQRPQEWNDLNGEFYFKK